MGAELSRCGASPPVQSSDHAEPFTVHGRFRMAAASFANKVCIVTGGASGLGKELCRQLAQSSALVVLADINEPLAHRAAAEIASTGRSVKAVMVDVADASSMQRLIDGSRAEFGRIDYIFNNAGIAALGEIRDLSLQDWRRVLDVNLMGVIHGIHFAYPIMIQQGFGHIVNICSGFGIVPAALYGPYVASKFANFGISNVLRLEAHGLGINVTVVCPGYIKTEMTTTPANADAESIAALIPVPMMDVRLAAQLILAGVARKKATIIFPLYVRVSGFVFHFLPRLFTRISLKQVARFRERRRL